MSPPTMVSNDRIREHAERLAGDPVTIGGLSTPFDESYASPLFARCGAASDDRDDDVRTGSIRLSMSVSGGYDCRGHSRALVR